MTEARLTDELATRVLGWRLSANRYLMESRSWRPKWRFQPLERIEDALKLLDAVSPDEFTICFETDRKFYVRVRIAGVLGEARDVVRGRAITLAVARAIGVNDSVEGEAE